MILAFAAAAGDLSEPSLWTIVITLAGIVVVGGKWVVKQLALCERDRKKLTRNVGILQVEFALHTGKTIDFDSHDDPINRRK